MKKNRKKKGLVAAVPVVKNVVAKYAHKFNKAHIFKTKTTYQRRAKHKGKVPFTLSFFKDNAKGFFLFYGIEFNDSVLRLF